MSERDEWIERLAGEILDGASIDWASAQSGAHAVEGPLLEHLQLLAKVADLNRRSRSAQPSGPPAARSFADGEIVADRFRIVRLIGEGGMGEVYAAEDLLLGNEAVALKTVRATLAVDEKAVQRLSDELRLARRITDPHVCRVYDVYRHESKSGSRLLIFTMELIEGQTLADRLHQGPMPPAMAFPLVRQLATALDAAHRAHVAHGDFKPANIILVPDGGDDRVVVTDFGLARWLPMETGLLSTRGDSRRWGTPAYMAPEQFVGKATSASDIYAFGLVICEMITGHRPFAVASGEVDAPRFRAVRTVQRASRPSGDPANDLDPRWEAAILRCLEVDPKRRFPSAGAVVEALDEQLPSWTPARRRSMLAAAALLGIAIVTAGVLRFWPIGSGQSARVAVAVADFANETGETELDGLSGMLITALEQSPRLSVLTRARVLDILKQTAHADVSRIDERWAREIWRHVGASVLVLPSIRRFGRLYTVDLKVLDPEKNEYILTARADGQERESIPGLIDRVSERIRSTLHEQPEEIRRTSRNVGDATTANLAAYQAYFNGEELLNQLKFDQARIRFKDAIALDPQFGLAYYRLAYANTWPVGYERHAREPLNKALELIDRIPEKERHLVRALDAMIGRGFDAAVPILEQLDARFPNDKEILFMLGDCHYHASRFERGLEYFQQVLTLDPTFLRALHHAANTYRALQQYDKMRDVAARYAVLAPGEDAYRLVADGYMLANDFDGGIRELRALREKAPEFQAAVAPGLLELLIRTGRDAEVAEEIASGKWPAEGAYTQRLWIRTGGAYLNRGSPRAAERWFRKFVDTEQGAKDTEALTGLGWSLLGQNRYSDAEQTFNRALAVSANNASALYGLFEIKMQNKSYDAALAFAQRMREVQPATPFGYSAEVAAHVRARRLTQAGEALNSGLDAVEGVDQRRQLLVGAALVYSSIQQYDQADDLLRRARELDAQKPSGSVTMAAATILIARERYVEAEDMLLAAQALEPLYAGIHNLLVSAALGRGEFATAVRRLNERAARAALPSDRAWIEWQLAQVELLQRRYAAAERHIGESLKLQPEDNASAYRLLAYVLAEQGRFAEARDAAEKAIIQQVDFASRNLLAWVLVAGDLDVKRGLRLAQEALGLQSPEYANALKLFPYLALPDHTLGAAYLKLEQRHKAVSHLERAAEAAPQRSSVQELLRQARK